MHGITKQNYHLKIPKIKLLLYTNSIRHINTITAKNFYGNKDDDMEIDDDMPTDMSPNRKKAIRVRGRVAYDGTNFSGWQYQPKGRTVQGELESVISRRFDRPMRVVGAGRTDAGVHARGQAFHFDIVHKKDEVPNDDEIFKSIDINKLQLSINSMLPRDIQIWNLSYAPSVTVAEKIKEAVETATADSKKTKTDTNSNVKMEQKIYSWHAIASSTKKIYSYRIYVGPAMNPLDRFHRAHIHDPEFQIEKLPHVLKYFEGTHDFRAFSGAIEQNARKQGKTAENTDTVRTVYKVNFVKESEFSHTSRNGDGNYRIDIILNGALYKMVRNIMGTSFDVCRGKITEKKLLSLLHQGTFNHEDPVDGNIKSCDDNEENRFFFDRDCNPCKPAPPEGLTLEKVFYYDDF